MEEIALLLAFCQLISVVWTRLNPLKLSDMVSPFKMEAQKKCGLGYENHRYVCDPANLASLSNLARMDELLRKKGFCACTYLYKIRTYQLPNYACPREYVNLIAAPRAAVAIMNQPHGPEDQFLDDVEDNRLITGKLYASALRREWSSEVCQLDVLFLGMDWGNRTHRLYVAFGDRLEKYGSFFRQSIERFYPIIHKNEKQDMYRQFEHIIHVMPNNVFSNETHWRALIRNPFEEGGLTMPPKVRKRPVVVHQWPTWSVIVFGSCVVLIFLSLVIGNCIDKTHRQAYFTRGLMARQSNRRWGAGFAGGMMTKQPGASKGLGNTMMFRNFNRPKANTSNYV